MPFPLSLPTTSSVLLSDFFGSPSHPSLPLEATTRRSVLKDALKKYKRLPPKSRASGLSAVQDALANYIPYLLAISTGAGCLDVGNERVDVEVLTPLTVEWRTTLSAALPGREAARPKLTGLHNEIAFVFTTLAYTHSLLARQQLSMLHGSASLSNEQRTAAISAALKHLLEAYNIHTYLVSIPSVSAASRDSPSDIQPSTISALASLALAEAWLVVVFKDDPYAAAVAEDRNESNKDWMFKAPTIPKVRAHLYARLCLAAADHAGTASGLLGSAKIDDDLVKYVADLRRTARGKAARFLAIDAELAGKTGEGLAWLKGARKELGFTVETEDGKRKGLRGLKHSWQEKREDRRAEKGGEWGLDAGRLEEGRVLEMLETKWERENSAVNVQVVPAWEPLLAGMPSGRDYPKPEPYRPPVLEGSVLARLRVAPQPSQLAFRGEEEDSGDEGVGYGRSEPAGAFPGSEGEYGRSGTSSSYY